MKVAGAFLFAMGTREVADRFARLRRRRLLGREVPEATSLCTRLLGLSLMGREQAGPGLLIPRCSSVHTFGMRFDLDLYFLDREGRVLAVRRCIPPRRFARHRGAVAVLEVPAQGGESASPRA